MAGSPDSRDVKLTMAFLREDAPRTTVVEPTFHRQYDGVVEIGGAGPGSPNARNWNRFFEQHGVTVRNGRTALGPAHSGGAGHGWQLDVHGFCLVPRPAPSLPSAQVAAAS